MAVSDYTTLQLVKTYGDLTGTKDDALLSSTITAMSSAIDRYCHQSFYTQTFTNAVYRGEVDKLGMLSIYPPTPLVNTITALAWRTRGNLGWNTLDVTQAYAINADSGAVIRVTTPDFTVYRGMPFEVQATLSVGYATIDTLPPDLEYSARRLVWWSYKKRSAVDDKTAIPELGVVIVPSAWPSDVKATLAPYVNWYPK